MDSLVNDCGAPGELFVKPGKGRRPDGKPSGRSSSVCLLKCTRLEIPLYNPHEGLHVDHVQRSPRKIELRPSSRRSKKTRPRGAHIQLTTANGTRALAGVLLVSSLFACAAHREAGRKEREELAQAQARVRACVVNFVVKIDSPRLTGFELAEAGAAACAGESEKLRQLAIEQDELKRREIDALVESTITDGQREALAALAVRDRRAAPAPVKSAPQPGT